LPSGIDTSIVAESLNRFCFFNSFFLEFPPLWSQRDTGWSERWSIKFLWALRRDGALRRPDSPADLQAGEYRETNAQKRPRPPPGPEHLQLESRIGFENASMPGNWISIRIMLVSK
jgi:hypothetical protein